MPNTPDPQAARDRLFALIASIPGSGTIDWCGPARALLDEIAVVPSAAETTNRAALLDEVATALIGRHCSPKSVAIVRRLVNERLCTTCQAYGQTVEDRPDGGIFRRCKDCSGEGLRRVAAEEQPAETQPWLSDSARIGRALIWSWSDVGKGAFGEGYRAAQAEVRALLGGERGTDGERPAVVEQPDTQTREADEDPARIDRLRPEFTEHSSIEAIDAQLHRARTQGRRWHLRTEWLISLRQRRVDQQARGEWPGTQEANPPEDAAP
ncbi:hypothetical protein P1S61_37640 [Streptomyces sp. ME08-AFT2]|uniref:hypothetical protein n=1 Tax=Streptomyces sp. ME08-AFT2 TaxID=3028683 RepID=UPI0029B6E283|nr:hypothetical protein [Streptomyces sp. ME08-AFT2]MDX3314681.1 hypothetical protein [Streptomyces sp. ME08-AFT2]